WQYWRTAGGRIRGQFHGRASFACATGSDSLGLVPEATLAQASGAQDIHAGRAGTGPQDAAAEENAAADADRTRLGPAAPASRPDPVPAVRSTRGTGRDAHRRSRRPRAFDE